MNEIDRSVEFLRRHKARRDPSAGRWLTESGEVLASDPVESAAMLRNALVSEHYRAAQFEGRMQTR